MNDAVNAVAEAQRRFQQGDRSGALVLVRRILAAGPDLGETWANLTWLAEQLGDFEAALQAARRFMMRDPLDPIAGLRVAELLGETGRTDEALMLAEAFCDQRPGDAAPQYYAGQFEARLGDFDRAIERLRRALVLKSDLTAAWEQIAAIKTFTADDPDIAAMEALNDQMSGRDAGVRAPLLYALGKAYDDVGDVDRAFERFSEGARLMAAERPFDGRRWQGYVDATLRDFDRGFLARQPASGAVSDRPIFVTGAPRSGTTLVEQILASHSGVRGGGELNLFRLAAVPIAGANPAQIEVYTGAAAQAGAVDPWGGFGSNYLAFLTERMGSADRIVDKTLNQAAILGQLRLALPNAPLVWVQRNPFDVAWSAFRTRFARGQDWSWSLTETARWLHGNERLRRHWSELLGPTLLTVDYQGLVTDPEAWVPRLLNHVGLTEEPAVYDFHKTRRAVDTASLAQVRQPLSAASVGSWKRYERHMRPFVEAWEKLEKA
jgi:hypothetical protein